MRLPLPETGSQGRVLADWVTASLREAILRGHFHPGERLEQELIAQNLSVSLTPVREAVRRLEAEGFIQVRPHYGAFIATVSCDEIRQIYEIRRLLEIEMARQITPLIPEDVIHEAQALLVRTQAEVDAANTQNHFAVDTYFEEMLLRYMPNHLIRDVLVGFKNRIYMLRYLSQFQSTSRLTESLKEHYEIICGLVITSLYATALNIYLAVSSVKRRS